MFTRSPEHALARALPRMHTRFSLGHTHSSPFPPSSFSPLVQQFESQPKVRLLLIVTTQESEDNELRERSWLKV